MEYCCNICYYWSCYVCILQVFVVIIWCSGIDGYIWCEKIYIFRVVVGEWSGEDFFCFLVEGIYFDLVISVF